MIQWGLTYNDVNPHCVTEVSVGWLNSLDFSGNSLCSCRVQKMSGKIFRCNVSKQCHLMVHFRTGTCGLHTCKNTMWIWLGLLTFCVYGRWGQWWPIPIAIRTNCRETKAIISLLLKEELFPLHNQPWHCSHGQKILPPVLPSQTVQGSHFWWDVVLQPKSLFIILIATAHIHCTYPCGPAIHTAVNNL